MVAASLIATIKAGHTDLDDGDDEGGWDESTGMDSEEKQYLSGQLRIAVGSQVNPEADNVGEYKTILQLVTVLSHGKRTSKARP